MIEVILATHNGERTLGMMLPRPLQLMPPPVPWRLTVVDNASTDGTRALLQSFSEKLDLSQIDFHEVQRAVSTHDMRPVGEQHVDVDDSHSISRLKAVTIKANRAKT